MHSLDRSNIKQSNPVTDLYFFLLGSTHVLQSGVENLVLNHDHMY